MTKSVELFEIAEQKVRLKAQEIAKDKIKALTYPIFEFMREFDSNDSQTGWSKLFNVYDLAQQLHCALISDVVPLYEQTAVEKRGSEMADRLIQYLEPEAKSQFPKIDIDAAHK